MTHAGDVHVYAGRAESADFVHAARACTIKYFVSLFFLCTTRARTQKLVSIVMSESERWLSLPNTRPLLCPPRLLP